MAALFGDYEVAKRSGLFDPEYYLTAYPDIAERNIDPLVHYLEEGAREGRNPSRDFDAAFYLDQCKERGETPDNPLIHYIRIGAARGFKTGRAAGGPAMRAPAPPDAQGGTAKMPILVAVETLGVAGLPGGGSRLSIGGWALASASITEIAAALDGNPLGKANYGLPRPDIAALYPGRAEASHAGFMLSVELPGRIDGSIEPVLSVRTAEGEIGRRALRIDVPPQEVEIPIIDPLLPAGSEAGQVDAAMKLYIDAAAVDRHGILHVEGWVVCLVQIQSVEVLTDGERVGEAEFGRVREDVERELSDYPNARFSGFVLVGDVSRLGAGRKTVTVRATACTGITREVSSPVTIPQLGRKRTRPEGAFHYHCDEIVLTTDGVVAVKGWAVCGSPTISIKVLLSGREIGEAALGIERPDVGNMLPMFAHARQSGFAFNGDAGKPVQGEHLITLKLSGQDGESEEIPLPALAVEVPRRTETDSGESAGDRDRRLHVDSPRVVGGVMEMPVRGNLEIGGWALARAGVERIEVALDGNPIALADYGLRRLDIQAAFPDWENALASGFLCLLPHRLLPKGHHTIAVALHDRAGKTAAVEFRIEVESLSETTGPWSLKRRIGRGEIELAHRLLASRDWHPQFRVVLPLADDAETLRKARVTLASLAAQVYAGWRLFIVLQGGPKQTAADRRLRDSLSEGLPAIAERIEIGRQLATDAITAPVRKNGGSAEPAFFTLLTPGDELGCDALLEMALATAMHADADFLYSDERRLNPESGTVEAFFKPQWSPDLLLSTNYIGRLWCARTELLHRVADPDEELIAHGDYDLVLRCTEAARAIRHVPAVLCERTDQGADDGERKALERAIVRRGIAGEIGAGLVPGTYRLKRTAGVDGLVSIIIPTCAAQGMIQTCIETLRRVTANQNFEIVCIENIPPERSRWREWLYRNADWVVSTDEPFNWSRFNNLAAAQSTGEYLLFLNDDIEIVDPDWLDALLVHAQRPEIGAVGPLLLYPDGRVQHAGMFLAMMGQGRHAFRYTREDDPGYFGLARTERNVIAVTGACLMTRRDTFDALGGFNEAHSVINNDLDYCLRAWRSGRRNLYTPHARLLHHEAASRAGLADDYDSTVFDSKWRDLFLAGDPYFHCNLAKNRDDFSADDEPTQIVVTGAPTIVREQVRKILVVKLDHIGDCIIAFPAIRRLKRHFPQARLSVLTSRASRSVWALEPSIEQIFEFDFFHSRSALGLLQPKQEDWDQLREQLAGERFDLAVDLRKHLETRPVLQHTGARYLAGFDHRNQFAWLDVALDWGGDQAFARKRQHTGEDLINLVDAVAAAADPDRTVIAEPPPAISAGPMPAEPIAAPLICVHPTAGNEMKQWPTEYFAALIDRLVEDHGARIVLVGGSGEEDTAAGILARLRNRKAVTSLVGDVPLADLPSLLRTASLFIGNDSGPKHIAAGLGIPTVGIHSGTVDVREWGPIGPRAVAVAREVVCSPCYLSKLEDCRRGLVCMRQLGPDKVYEACKRLLLFDAQKSSAEPAMAATVESPRYPPVRTRRKPGSVAAAVETDLR